MEVLKVPHRYQRDLLVKGLKSFFGDFNDDVLAGILPSLTWVELTGGERLFQFGDVGEELYFVVSGRLRASIPGANGSEHVFGEIARGETIGEMSVITGEPRTATVHAVRTSVLVRLDRVRFETLLRDFPAISFRLTRLIVERLRRAERRHLTTGRQNKTLNHPVTIGVIGVRCGQTELLEFVQQLGRELRRWGKTLVLSGAVVERRSALRWQTRRVAATVRISSSPSGWTKWSRRTTSCCSSPIPKARSGRCVALSKPTKF